MECIVWTWTTSTITGNIFLLLPNWRRTYSFDSTGRFFCNRKDPYFWIGKILTFCFVLSPSLVHLNIISSSKKTRLADVIADITTHGWSHIYGLPYPSVDSLYPMDWYYTFMFLISSLKNLVYCCTGLLIPYSRVHANFDLKHAYIEMCA